MVIGGTEDEAKRNVEDQSDNDEVLNDQESAENYDIDDPSAMKQRASFRFADHSRGNVEDQSDNDEVPNDQETTDTDDPSAMRHRAFRFADHSRARIRTVRC